MSLPLDCDSFGELCCDECHFQKFSSQYEFKLHRTAHKSDPIVTLVRLSEYTLEKLEHRSYKVNGGVAKKSMNYVSPLKISLKKQQGTTTFQVIRKQKTKAKEETAPPRFNKEESKGSNKILQQKNQSAVNVEIKTENEEVEGNSLLERFGANISISRKSVRPPAPQVKCEGRENDLDDNDNVNTDISSEKNQGKNLEGGESDSRRKSVSSNEDHPAEETNLPAIVNVFSKSNSEDLNQIKNGSESNIDNEKQIFCKNSIFNKLTGAGLSLVPKSSNKTDNEKLSELNDGSEKENKLQKLSPVNETDVEGHPHSNNTLAVVNSNEESKTVSNYESTRNKDNSVGKKLGEDKSSSIKVTVKTTVNGIDDGKTNFSGNRIEIPKKHVRVKNSKVSKKTIELGKKDSAKDISSEEADSNIDSQKGCNVPDNSCDASVKQADTLKQATVLNSSYNQEGKGMEKRMKKGINSISKPQMQADFIAPRSDCGTSSPAASVLPEPQIIVADERKTRGSESGDRNVLSGSSNGKQNGDSSTFRSVNCDDDFQSEPFVKESNSRDENNEVAVAYSALPNESQSLSTTQEDPLLTSDSPSGNGGSLNQNFLHEFLNEPSTPQSNMQTEGSEYMSLERLAQVSGLDSQRGQSNFDLGSGDPGSPMEQLSQQVQRLPNPPQINVIPQHHMQAPQPPQLHTGLPPLATPPTNSFDSLGHIQPPMPPLYQGYNMYNQNFTSQGPQQLPPRPPMLQQRPQLPGRSFQNLSSTPRPRNRSSYSAKRSAVRLPGPQEVPPKQRRMDTTPPARSQQSNISPTPKIPSGITVTPSKKNLEASKVANVLASRGITVTPSPAAVRQSSPSNRSQQRSNPVLNIGPGVSITANNGSRSSGGFLVPGSRRNNPIVNPDVERPERCATVDLTQDDDPPSSSLSRLGRFACGQCRKGFPTFAALEEHKASHRASSALPFKCDKCTAQYPNASGLRQHKTMFHKTKQAAPDLAIPIVDLNHPGARDQLSKCGIRGFLPLSQLQSNSLGYFGVPIIHLDSTKEKAVSNLNSLGVANILVLGKMKTLSQPQIR